MQDDLPIDDRFSLSGKHLRVVYSRSGGPGGQNVNTRSTKAQLYLDLTDTGLNPAVIARLRKAHPSKVTSDDEFLISASTHRTQDANTKAARERLAALIRDALWPPAPRKETKPTRASKRRRLESKKRTGELKKGRGAWKA